VLLYGCEVWTPYRRHIKALEAFHVRCLQTILGVRWWQKIPHIEMFSEAEIIPVEHFAGSKPTALAWAPNTIA